MRSARCPLCGCDATEVAAGLVLCACELDAELATLPSFAELDAELASVLAAASAELVGLEPR